MKRLRTFKSLLKYTLMGLFFLCIGTFCMLYLYMEWGLPGVEVLKDAHLQEPLRIYSAQKRLIAEYGQKRRIPIAYEDIPKPLIEAVLATEDARFFDHPGVDLRGMARAAVNLISTGQKSQGGSTITMQVARNFFLSSKKTYSRKFKEILLAIKIDKEFSKEKILELYFNKVYLGNRAYGFAAAAQIYYGKPLNELTLAQYAMLAGLPKAPSRINPIVNPGRALDRRNFVLSRMLTVGFITDAEYEAATEAPITAKLHQLQVSVNAPYVGELIRQQLAKHYGDDVYSMGLNVYTTIDDSLQNDADSAVQSALLAYDKRHGYRGPEGNLRHVPEDTWQTELEKRPVRTAQLPAAVTNVNDDEKSIQALLANGDIITISFSTMTWARPQLKHGYIGKAPQAPSDVVRDGDIIRVHENHAHHWVFSQVPEAEGALVAMNPNTGAVLALDGGLNFSKSNFNRVTQAKRQAGSSFKPFVYAAALDKGLTLATIINDSPIVMEDSGQKALWRPENDTHKFYGPTRLREGLIHSRNLVSIRMLQRIGIDYTTDYVTRFGFKPEQLPHSLSLALGTSTVSPLQMASAYSIFANGGYAVTPHIIDHIVQGLDRTIYQADFNTICDSTPSDNDDEDAMASCAPRVLSAQTEYLINSALQDVVQHGTAHAARSLKRTDLAGKTGTTNDQVDAWFAGYNQNVVAIAWMGFDNPVSLHEYGAQAALPMWMDFMRQALKGVPDTGLTEPPGIVTARINPQTGLLVHSGEQPFIYEVFRQENVPAYQTVSNTTNMPVDNTTPEIHTADNSATQLY